MIKLRLTKRIEVLEKAADLKGFIPVLIIEDYEEYEVGNLPRGVTEQTVIMIDDIGKEL